MKKISLTAAVLGAALAAHPADAAQREFPADGIKKLRVQSESGPIQVRAGRQDLFQPGGGHAGRLGQVDAGQGRQRLRLRLLGVGRPVGRSVGASVWVWPCCCGSPC